MIMTSHSSTAEKFRLEDKCKRSTVLIDCVDDIMEEFESSESTDEDDDSIGS